jgi:hypothetical protein
MTFNGRRGVKKQLGVILAGSLLNLSLGGCFPLQPVEGMPAPASDVRVHLTEPAATRVSSQTRLPVTSVSGQVVRAVADSLVLLVHWGDLARSAQGWTVDDTVRFGGTDIERIEAPRFSLTRSLLFAGGAVLVIVGLLSFVPGAFNPGGDDDPDPPEPR